MAGPEVPRTSVVSRGSRGTSSRPRQSSIPRKGLNPLFGGYRGDPSCLKQGGETGEQALAGNRVARVRVPRRRTAPGWLGPGGICPPRISTTDELMSTTRHSTHIDLERLTGIHERRVSIGDEDSYSLATSAARDCLEKAQQKAASLDVVISCSITKLRGGLTQWLEPTMSSAVARAIGAEKAMTFDLSNACAGMLTGVTVLNNWIRQERRTRLGGQRRVHLPTRPDSAARHIRNIMSKELASPDTRRRRSGAPAWNAPRRVWWDQSGRLHHRCRLQPTLPGLSEGPRSGRPDVHQFPGDPARGDQGHPTAAARSPRVSGHLNSRHRSRDHTSNLGPRDTQGAWPQVSASFGESPRHDAVITVRSLRQHGIDDPHSGPRRGTDSRAYPARRDGRR